MRVKVSVKQSKFGQRVKVIASLSGKKIANNIVVSFHMQSLDNKKESISALKKANRVVVFTGAGMSAVWEVAECQLRSPYGPLQLSCLFIPPGKRD